MGEVGVDDPAVAHDGHSELRCRRRDHPLDTRLVSGTVDHGNGIALEPEDIDDGYLLACQATPRSAEVEIEIE